MDATDQAALKDIATLTRELSAHLPPAIGALVVRQLNGALTHLTERLEHLAVLEAAQPRG